MQPQTGKQSEQKPTLGRIVTFTLAFGGVCPAIIQNVAADGTLSLCVFGPKGPVMQSNALQGEGAGFWAWPARY
jgi:hypothetical protein